MSYQMLVKNLFNDMYLFFSGGEAIGLQRLMDDYEGEPLLTAFLSNLDQALEIPYMDAMQESYGFYKRYCGRTLTDSEWDTVISEIRAYMEKWPNDWCKGIILALLELLEREEKKNENPLNESQKEQTEEQRELEPAA